MTVETARPARRSALRGATLNLRAISLIAGLRAATACAVPVIVAELLDQPGITWMAVAGFWACLADNGGSLRTRLAAMAGVTLIGGAATGLAALIAAAAPLWVAVLYAAAIGFGGSFARIFGSVATSVGLLVTTSSMVAIGFRPLPLADIPAFAALYVAGGLWAIVLTLVIWRLHPHQPARDAISDCYRALAALARGIARVYHQPHPGHAEWDSLSLSRRRPSREAIEAARALLADIRRGRLGESGRGEGLILLLESADQIFLALIGLSDLLERSAAGSEKEQLHRLVEATVDRIAPGLDTIAAVLSGRAAPADFAVDRAVADLEAQVGAQPGALVQQTVALLHSLARLAHAAQDIAREVSAGRTLAELVQRAAAEGNEAARMALSAGAQAPQRLWWDEVVSRVRANLTWRSIGFRHAVRLGLTAAAAVGVTQAFAIDRGYWLTVTAVVILQPYYATTWRRALDRVGGSVLGGLIAAAIGLVVTTPLSLALMIFPLAAIASAFRFVNYGLFTFLLTPQFVLISELAQPSGAGNLDLAAERALASIGGGVLALLAGSLLWPTRERRHLRQHLAGSLGAAADYLGAVLDVATGAGKPARQVEECRRRAGLASNNAEGSLDRLLGEPGPRPREAEAAMALVTGARRLAGAATSLWLMHDLAPVGSALPELPAFAQWVRASLAQLSDAVTRRAEAPPLAPSPEILADDSSGAAQHLRDTLARIARQIRILHGAARRLADPGEGN